MRYNPRLHCSAGCRRADGRATSEPYQMRVRPSRGPGGRGRRGRAGGHGATSSQGEARADWRRRRGQGWRGRPPVARPDKIIDPCTGGAGSHGSSRPPVTRRAVASPLTSALSPLGQQQQAQPGKAVLQIPLLSQICSVGLRGAGQTGKRRCRGCPHSTFEVAVRSKHVRLPPINSQPVFAQL